MPHIELTDLECKVLWLVLDRQRYPDVVDPALIAAEISVFAKVYRAYRGMLPEQAA